MDLLAKTIALLNVTNIPFKQISKDTGLKDRWLRLVKDGDIEEPSVVKIEKLYNYLVKN